MHHAHDWPNHEQLASAPDPTPSLCGRPDGNDQVAWDKYVDSMLAEERLVVEQSDQVELVGTGQIHDGYLDEEDPVGLLRLREGQII